MSADSALKLAIDSVPAGRWAVAVSGGADSVALLSLLRERSDLYLHIVHLNHELRGDESDGDARFVATLGEQWSLPATIAGCSEITLDQLYKNKSEHLRRVRLKLFAEVIARQSLQGVLVAHHQDDQIETVLHRLLRGSSYRGLCGMGEAEFVAGVTMRRPLLKVPRAMLREHLQSIGQPWREDLSNANDRQTRNRLRKFLVRHDVLRKPLMRLMLAMRDVKRAVDRSLIRWPDEIDLARLTSQPLILRKQSARLWLSAIGVPADRIDPKAILRLLAMIDDAASPSRIDLPGSISISRQHGRILSRPRTRDRGQG